MKEKIGKLDFINIKNFYSTKDTVKRKKTQVTEWKIIFVEHISDKKTCIQIYKELLKFNNKKTNYPIKKWNRDLNRHLTEADIEMANKHTKISSTHIIREL